MSQIFISYSKKDSDFAHKLADDLTAAGFKIWIDRSIGGGEDWRATIEKNLKEADEVIIVISPNSMDSEWVKHEGSLAYGWGKQLFPILLETVPSLPPWLEEYQWIDFETLSHENAFNALMKALTPPNPIQDLLEQQLNAHQQTGELIGEAILRVIEEARDTLHISPEAEDLLMKSAQAHEKRIQEQERINKRLRRFVIGLAGLSLLMLLALVLAFWQNKISKANNLAIQALRANDNHQYQLATLLALESKRGYENVEVNDLLARMPYFETPYGETLQGYAGWVNSVAWSPDGQLASGSDDGTVILWDTASGQPTQTLQGHSSGVNSVAWSPDGQLASASNDGTIILWDTASGQPTQTLQGHSDWDYSVAWSPDGQLASASADGTIILWDTASGQPTQTLQGHSGRRALSVAWSPDGQLASGADTVILWDIQSGQPAHILQGHSDWVNSVAWSPDGQLASGSNDGTIILWDTTSGQPTQTLQGHSKGVNCVAWSPDGQLASGSNDGTVILWNTQSGQPTQIIQSHSGHQVSSMAWSLDGLLASASRRTVILWDAQTGLPNQTLEGHTDKVNSIAWSPDGLLASASSDGNVILWDLSTNQPNQTLLGHKFSIDSVAWSFNGQLASAGCRSYNKYGICAQSEIIIWNISTGRPIQTLVGHKDKVLSVAWSPDGQLASASADGTVILWDTQSGQPTQTLQGHSEWVNSVAWSPDGQLASGSSDRTVIIWDTTSGQPIQTLQGNSIRQVNSIAWSPDGLLASASDGNVILWDLSTNQPNQTLLGHKFSIDSVAWSFNGQLASAGCRSYKNGGCVQSEIIIWNTSTGRPIQTLVGNTGFVNSIAWSPNGQLTSASYDSLIRIVPNKYTYPPCQWVGRNMTIDEWLNYRGLTIYRPTCSNLSAPNLSIDLSGLLEDYKNDEYYLLPLNNGSRYVYFPLSFSVLRVLPLTIKGWTIIIGVILFVLSIIILAGWGIFRLGRSVMRSIKKRWRKRIAP